MIAGCDIFKIDAKVPIAAGLEWQPDPAFAFEEKKDGVRAVVDGAGCVHFNSFGDTPGPLPQSLKTCTFDGELVGDTYWAFDLLIDRGQDIRELPLRERKARLAALAPEFPSWMRLIPSGVSLAAIVAAGGEGVVKKDLAAPYGQRGSWVKCRQATD